MSYSLFGGAGETSPERRDIVRLIVGGMLGGAFVVTFSTIFILYRAAVGQETLHLRDSARSLARMIEAVTRFDAVHSRKDHPEGSAAATLSQVVDAHGRHQGFGRTGEFLLARREGEEIRFLLETRHPFPGRESRLPIRSDLAEPMRRALLGRSGTVMARDYRGVEVLAAYEPVRDLDAGIVVKIDFSEIRAPFLRAGAFALLVAVLLALLAAVLPSRRAGLLLLRLKDAEREARDGYERQKTLNSLLLLGIERTPLDDVLARALDILFSVSWLKIKAQGCVFLWDEARGELVMKAQRGLSPQILESCSRVPKGRCLCGRAVARGETVFADRLDESHEVAYEGIAEHGHYCVPIKGEEGVLGVLNFYVAHGHARTVGETGFLEAVSRILGRIIEHHRAEEELDFKRSLLEAHTESAIDGILVVDQNGKPLLHNRRFAEMWGIPEEMLETGDDEAMIRYVFPKIERPEVFAGKVRYLHAHRDERSLDEIALKDGRVFERFSTPLKDGGGGYLGRAWYFRDLTERVRAERTLRESEERLDHLLRSSAAVIYNCRAEGDYEATFISPNVRPQLGYEPEDFTGDPGFWARNIHPEDAPRVFADLPRVFETGSHTHEYRFRAKDGSWRWMRDDLRLVRGEGGEPKELIGNWIDITDAKRLEEVARQSEKLSAVGQLAAGVAHELNNPLGVILGFAQGAARRIKEGDPLELPLRSIEREGLRCRDLVRDLLAFSRRGKPGMAGLDLSEAVRAALSLVRTQVKIRAASLEEKLEPGIWVKGSKQELQQVVINLCTNALDAMGKGGTLTVRTEAIERGGRKLAALRVSDTGAGVPEADRGRIFDPFYTTKEVGKGTGLGLSLVHEIAAKHEGTIECESEVGKGTTFIVSLPVVRVREAEPT